MTWKTLRHPNILPLVGVIMSETQFAMISDWMVHGNINDFVKAHPDANRLELVGLSFTPYCLHFKFNDNCITPLARRRC
jgi:hypothetical protein